MEEAREAMTKGLNNIEGATFQNFSFLVRSVVFVFGRARRIVCHSRWYMPRCWILLVIDLDTTATRATRRAASNLVSCQVHRLHRFLNGC